MSENTNSMTAIRMPKRFFQFITDNQKIAQIVGTGILTIDECERQISDVKEVFMNPEALAPLLQKGTQEELEEFLQAALEGTEFGIQSFNDLPDGVIEKVKEELGDQMLHTEIPQA